MGTKLTLEGSGILVTGGGTGIGKACAAAAVAEGAKVMICGRTRSRLEDVAKALKGDGAEIELIQADVTDEDQVAAAVKATIDWAGNLKGVVANAGGGGGMGPYHLQDLDEFRRVLELNVIGTMLCVKHSVPPMVAAGGGSFVGMSSIAATKTHPVFGAYPVAKAGIDAMMRNAADEYGPAGVRFNSVQPGFVTTEIMEGIPRDSSVYDSYLQNTPLGGVSAPEEIGRVVAFLLGPGSARITGQHLAVDGGHNLRSGPDFRPFTGLSTDQLLARRLVTATGPLAGVRVVELGVWVAGPAAGGILADWGADVVKIEPPTGDPARTFRRMLGGDLPSNPVFELDNRSKRSVSVDLSKPEGLELALDLIDRADVFLTNIRVSALQRLGLGPDALRSRNRRLVYAVVTGYGLEGPDADRPAYDIAAFWARSGLAASLTPPGGNLPFQRGGMGDHSVGMTAAGMVSAALFARERTGEGDLVSSSLLRQGAYTIGFDVNISLMWGLPVRVGQRTTMGNPCINNYEAGDGRRFWIVGLEGDRHWPPLARAVGRPEWLTDERFATAGARFAHARELIAELDALFATKSLGEWAEIFAGEPDFFWSPVQTIDDLVADPQFSAGGGLVSVPDESGSMTMLATPADFADHPAGPRWRAPRLGEHTAEVLGELGFDDRRIAELVAAGVAFDQTTAQGPD